MIDPPEVLGEAGGGGKAALPTTLSIGQRANFGGGLGEREANAEPPPAGAQALAAPIYGGRWSSRGCAAAGVEQGLSIGQRANFGGGLGEREANAEPPPAGAQTLAALIYGGRWSSRGCAAASRAEHRRNSCGVEALSFPHSKNLEALIYGRQIRLAGASKWLSALPTLPTFGHLFDVFLELTGCAESVILNGVNH